MILLWGTPGDDPLDCVRGAPAMRVELTFAPDGRVGGTVTHSGGERVLATRVLSDADDYRYASRTGSSVMMVPDELPDDLGAACVEMTRGMGLHVAGIDLRQTPDGAWYCFEVSPSPEFSFYEAVTGQPISAAIAELLARRDPGPEQP